MSMMDIFNNQPIYGESVWDEIERRDFNDKEKSQIRNAMVKQGEYGLSCCFFLKRGGMIYYPFSRDAQDKVHIGEKYTLDELLVITLQKRDDDSTITRIDVKD